MNDEYGLLFNIVLIGDSGVGKSNLISRFIRDEVNLDSKSTIGPSLHQDQLKWAIRRSKLGYLRPRAMSSHTSHLLPQACRSSSCLRHDQSQTYDNVRRWLKELRDLGDTSIVIVLLGTRVIYEICEQSLRKKQNNSQVSIDGYIYEDNTLILYQTRTTFHSSKLRRSMLATLTWLSRAS